MVEITEGTQVSLNQILSGGLTFKGKPLKFELVDKDTHLYQAATNLTDEEIAAGNNDFVFGFSFGQVLGTIGVAQVPISEEERNEIAEKVRKAKEDKDKTFKPKALNRAEDFSGKKTNELATPLVNSRGEPAGDPTTDGDGGGESGGKATENTKRIAKVDELDTESNKQPDFSGGKTVKINQ